MKSAFDKLAVGMLLIGVLSSGQRVRGMRNLTASPTCLPQSWNGQSAFFLPISASASDDRIVGMWYVTFTAQGSGEVGPPDGAPPIDMGAAERHRPRCLPFPPEG